MIKTLLSMSNRELALLMARLAFGVSIFMHGAVRIPKLSKFAEGLSSNFAETFVAGWPALTMAYTIPFLESLSGLAILIGGKFIRWGLFTAGLTMGLLMFGTCLIEKWDILPSQLLHMVTAFLILYHLEDR